MRRGLIRKPEIPHKESLVSKLVFTLRNYRYCYLMWVNQKSFLVHPPMPPPFLSQTSYPAIRDPVHVCTCMYMYIVLLSDMGSFHYWCIHYKMQHMKERLYYFSYECWCLSAGLYMYCTKQYRLYLLNFWRLPMCKSTINYSLFIYHGLLLIMVC